MVFPFDLHPIALLPPFLSNFFSEIIYCRLKSFLDERNILEAFQSGFETRQLALSTVFNDIWGRSFCVLVTPTRTHHDKKTEVFGPRDTASVPPDLLFLKYLRSKASHLCVTVIN